MFRTTITGFADLLYPPTCPGCGGRRSESFACADCRSTFHASGPVGWDRALDGVMEPTAVWTFDEGRPIQQILHRLKYSNSPWLGLDLGRALADILAPKLVEAEARGGVEASPASSIASIVVPVPLHEARRLDRGYNQSEWIGRGVAGGLGIPLETGILVRKGATRSQTTLSREERWQNVEDAFEVAGPGVEGRLVILIDDTITTGATLFSCATVLRVAGAHTVMPAGVATAPLRMAAEPPSGFPVIPA